MLLLPTTRTAILMAQARTADADHAEATDKRSARRLARAKALQARGAFPCLSGELYPLATPAGRRDAQSISALLVTTTGPSVLNDMHRARRINRIAQSMATRKGRLTPEGIEHLVSSFSSQFPMEHAIMAMLLPEKIAHAEAKAILKGHGLDVDTPTLSALMRRVNPSTSRAGGRPYKVRTGRLAAPFGTWRRTYSSTALPLPVEPTQVPLTPKGQTHGRGFGRGSHPLWASV